MPLIRRSIYTQIQTLDSVFKALLLSCSNLSHIKQTHTQIIKSPLNPSLFLCNNLLSLYCKRHDLPSAQKLFDEMPKRDSVSYTSLVSGYSQSGRNKEAFQIFVQMHKFGFGLNTFALGSIIKACISLDFIQGLGEMIHGCIIKIGLEKNIFVGSAMIDLYAKNGLLHEAIMVFKSILYPNVVVYNTIIAGFYQIDNYIYDKEITKQALLIFSQMEREGIKPSEITFSSILCASNLANEFEFGKQIHAQVIKYNLKNNKFIGSALIDLYSNSGFILDALKCFNLIFNKDITTYTCIISGLVQNKLYEKALQLFHKLLQDQKRPDLFTISGALNACANLGIVRSGEQIQVWATKLGLGFQKFIIIGNLCIAMYAKSGCFNEAVRVFNEMEFRDVVSWSAIITGHANHDSAKSALELFDKMEKSGVKPNEFTYLGVLIACNHAGLVNQGLRYYERMKQLHGLEPTIKHFSCIVDLLARAGKITHVEFESLISNSNFKTDLIVGRSLLSSCRAQNQIEIATQVFHNLENHHN